MNTRSVDPNTVAVWRWQAFIFAGVLLIPLTAIVIGGPTGLALVAAMLGFGAIACAWLLPKAHYRALRFGHDYHGIVIESGIWWRKRTALPRVRVQHSDVSQGPLQRRYGVATLTFYTAGSRYTKIDLAGLEHEEAVALRDVLLARGDNSGV